MAGAHEEGERERRREGTQGGKEELGMSFVNGLRGVDFIVFRGTVDLVIRIGARTQRTMTE